jgi:TRAP-type C4-dicarboxylate transport system substrate-binding protein
MTWSSLRTGDRRPRGNAVTAILTRAFVAVLLILSATAARSATIWECYVYNPVATLPSVQGIVRLIDAVKQQTNGELEINLHLGGSLPIKATDITAAVGDNVVQLGDDGFATGTIPITAILRLPMLLQNSQDLEKAMTILRPHLDDAYGKRGIVVLGQYAYPFQVIWGKKRITSLADIEDMKLRVTSVEQGEFVRRFGGVSLPLGSPDVAAALDRGVVEGVFTASSGGGLTWHDLLKYRYGFPTSYVNSTIVVNREAFEKLPPATQKILRDTASASADWTTSEMKRVEDDVTAQFGKEGMVLTAASPEDIKEATEKLRPYWDDWAAKHSAEAVAILKEIRVAVGR